MSISPPWLRGRTRSWLLCIVAAFCAVTVPGARSQGTTLVVTGAVWRYLDNGSNQGTAWRELAFDDSAWAAGPAQLGYGDGDEATIVSGGTNANSKYITTYFRRAFTVEEASAVSNLTLRLLRDDGGVVYLNGIEIHRGNMPTGAVDYLTLAASSISAPAESTFNLALVDPAALVTGTNVLAVEIHQGATNSADISFDLELISNVPSAAPSVAITSPANNSIFQTPISITLNASASDSDGVITLVEFFASGTKLGEDGTTPYSFTWNNVPAGSYVLTARATDSSGLLSTSAPITINVNFAGTALVARGSNWKYLDNGSDQGMAWQSLSFNDAGWAAGPAQLGYGDGDEATVVGYGPDPNNKFITTYFRFLFMVEDPSIYAGVYIDLLRDDGAVVYLNGREVFRSNMPGGTVNYQTPASSGVSGTAEATFFRGSAAGTNLVAGTNVLAVEVHQNVGSSSDLSFDLQLSGGSAAPALSRGPYLQIGTTNSAIVRWRTDLATESRVLYGTEPMNLAFTASDATSTTEHSVPITGLLPETKYYYSIGYSTNVLAGASTNFYFVTPPPIGSERPIRLWALGDSGTANDNARNVRNAYMSYGGSRRVDVWLMLGDNAYNTGQDSEYQTAVFDMYPTFLRNTFLWPAIGNHETAQSSTATSFPYLDIFTLPANGQAGGISSGTEKYYSFDYANVHFICLDSMTSSRSTNGQMLTWLSNDLASTLQRWIIAYWHHPPYTKGSHNSDTEIELIQMRANALPILEAGGVDLVLSGHSHAYERSFLLNGHYGLSTTLSTTMKKDAGDGREDGTGAYQKPDDHSTNQGAVYIVAGSSGQATGGSLNHPAMFVSLNVLGSVVLDITSNRLDAIFLNNNAVAQDHFTILKSPTHNAAPVAPTNFTASLIASNQIKLTWANNPTNEISFQIERSEDGTNFVQIVVLGANNTNYTDLGLLLSTAYYYRIRASNDVGDSDYSPIASATTPAPPFIVQQPESLTVAQGATANFNVTVSGTSPLSYQWQMNGTNLSGRTNPTLTLVNIQTTNAGGYRVRVTNLYGQVTSQVATLTVIIPPTITAQPQSQIANFGSNATFSITATGSQPLFYQWRFNGTNDLVGATNSQFTRVNVQDSNAGYYSAVVDNGLSITSSVALLTVNHLPVPTSPLLERLARQGVKARSTNLLGSDSDGDSLALDSVDFTSAQGGTIRTNAIWVFYAPPEGFTNADSFAYTVNDGRGGIASGTAAVQVKADPDHASNLVSEDLGNGSFHLRFSGIPGRTYSIQFAENPENPAWQTLSTTHASAWGSFEFVDTPPSGAAPRFYRSTWIYLP